jgi:hypothetical protein
MFNFIGEDVLTFSFKSAIIFQRFLNCNLKLAELMKESRFCFCFKCANSQKWLLVLLKNKINILIRHEQLIF